MTGLADCNNFFVSCERTVDPSLNGRAVVVLSNNDGCVVARSNEAKAIGIKMGQPAFEIKDLTRSGQVIALSGHHMLYKQISIRVHDIFARYAPSTIDYSVDEAFLDMSGIPTDSLVEIGQHLVDECWEKERIPVTIGFAPSKTLAKIATECAKKRGERVALLTDPDQIMRVLNSIEIGDLWGVGRRLAKRMYLAGIYTVGDFARRDMHWVREKFGVNGERSWLELHGTPCIELDHVGRKLQDSISESRTFPEDVNDFEYLRARVAMYADHCALRLQSQHGVCKRIGVMLRTNRFREGMPMYCPEIIVTLERPSNYAPTLIKAAIAGLQQIYDPRYSYKRAGLVLYDIVPETSVMRSLFDDLDEEGEKADAHPLKHKETPKKLIDVINRLNAGRSKPLIPTVSEMMRSHPKSNDGYSSSFGFRR